MSKSIKLKDDTYIDSTGIVHNRDLLSTILGNLSSLNTNNKSNLVDAINEVLNTDKEIDDFYNSNGNGYIRFNNGFQICWLTKTNQTLGGTAWSGTSVWFSDHTMGNWLSAFTDIYAVWGSVQALQYWSTCGGWNTTNAGVLRMFRPNSTTTTGVVRIVGIGRWK